MRRAALLTLLALLAHAALYAFLTDDAFISFRYARNLSEGHGLVFNPGFERVEGYTNFLWVIVLAGFSWIGIAPERVANPLLLLATIGLWAAVAAFAARSAPPGRRALAVGVATGLLAATRSVAVWSTSGLETRLFELLVVAATLRLLVETERLDRGDARVRPLAGLLFALASWTRPDGMLISACAIAAVWALRWRRLRQRLRWALGTAGICSVLVGAHLLFRRAYYGDWLPNTYYAKVGGFSWEMGSAYVEAFALEYAVYLWIPLLVAGLHACWRRGALVVPAVFAAVCLPHALYVIAIGGDHFEYRPLDLYFPFAYLLMADGAAALATDRRRTVATLAYLGVVGIGIVALPWHSHRQHPDRYRPGFPGVRLAEPEARGFLDPERSALYRLPGLRPIARAHQRRIRSLSRHFVGLRQEEHRLFLETTERQGRRLAALVEQGILPGDTYIATCCVGAIPYFSRLRTLDRLGLTDAQVARAAPRGSFMAHQRQADRSYAQGRGVELWAVDPVHLVWNLRSPGLIERLEGLAERPREYFFAATGREDLLVVDLLGGIEAARERFPRLRFEGTHDPEALRGLARRVRGLERPGDPRAAR